MRISIFLEYRFARFPSRAANRAKVWKKTIGIFEATLKKIELILSWITGNGFEFKSHYWGRWSERLSRYCESNPEQGFYLTSRGGGFVSFRDNFLSIFQRKE